MISNEEAKQTMIEIECLAKQVYESSIVLSWHLLYKWYQSNRSMWWITKHENRIVAYISAMPLKRQAFKKTLQPDFDESANINEGDIRSWNDGIDQDYSLYICSIVVHPDYQKRSDLPVFRLLVKYFLETLVSYGENGSTVAEWSAVAVSEVGCHILQNYFDLQCLSCDNHKNHIFYGITNIEHQQGILQRLIKKLQ